MAADEDIAVWTPKRVLLLAAGISVFLAGYTVYAFFLGGIDGMPPLPEKFLRSDKPMATRVSATDEPEIDKKLRVAFGKDCPQLKKHFRFEVRNKGIVVAAGDMSFKEDDGRVKMEDFSIALFKSGDESSGKLNIDDENNDNAPEITTITSDLAFLSFVDEHGKFLKIESATDMNKGKISGAELRGKTNNIIIINNRRTKNKNDDLEVIVKEPLFYDEPSEKIWTKGYVKLLDKKSQPNPTTISGLEMVMHLVKDSPAEKKQANARGSKVKNDLNGVDRIELKSTVEMDLYTEASSDFMTSGDNPSAKKKTKEQAPEKAHIKITTGGPFVYDVPKDTARFESPPAKTEASFPDQVKVQRWVLGDETEHPQDIKCDQLLCDVLTLKFRRRTETAKTSKSDGGSDREIESAQATARPGMDVVLVLDSNNLDCTCQQLDFQGPAEGRGARTVLRGEPLKAGKDGTQMTCRELQLFSANQEGLGQKMVAQGPGQVDLYDKTPDPSKGATAAKGYTMHAIWKGLLTQTKCKEGARDLDLLEFTVDAVFVDEERSQKLSGQTLKVWLEGSDAPPNASAAETPKDTAAGPRQKPAKIEAYDHVKAESPDSNIDALDRLTIRFKDVPLVAGQLPGSAPSTAPPAQLTPGAANVSPSAPNRAEPVPPVTGNSLNLGLTIPTREGKDKDKPKQPINLSAREVTVDVLRGADKNDLKELYAVSEVHVHQNGEKPGDKGVDIKGETLTLLHFVEGDIIKVFGDPREKLTQDPPRNAELQLEEVLLIGPKVTIDQKVNRAVVEGRGVMTLPSNTTFNGDKPTKPGTRLTVHWERAMEFDGKEAEFGGGVAAYQDDSTLQCEFMEVTLDHRVSLKEGQKGEEKAKVEKVLAYNNVCVIDNTKDDKGRPQIQRLRCYALDVDNQENQMKASGPGWAAALEYESPGELDGVKAPKQTKPADIKPPQLMLTRVYFEGQMFSMQFNETNRKTTFRGNVKVQRVPASNLDEPVDNYKLPKDGLWMDCQTLTVMERKLPDGSKSQDMQAEGLVKCGTNEMTAQADLVTFDKNQDIMTLKGSPSNPARMWRQVGPPGSERQPIVAQIIRYNRKTNTAVMEGVDVISGQLLPDEQFNLDRDLLVASR
jgi:lipopolysaccharide export system protein LptA